MRTFETGATRDNDKEKIDPEGFLSVPALETYFAYMHKHRMQADGSLRSSDNWQKGMELSVYMKSAWRHFFAVWKGHRAGKIETDDLCGVLFNIMGILHEETKEKQNAFTETGVFLPYADTPLKDFRTAKVGDPVWSSRFGWGKVIGRYDAVSCNFPIKVNFPIYGYASYTFDGRFFIEEPPTLFWGEQS